MIDWVTLKYKKEIEKFHKQIFAYCQEHQINPTFYNFINHGDGYVSDTFKYLLNAPKIYLANSKAFRNYYNKLDTDFQNSIYNKEQLKHYQHIIIHNDKLKAFLKDAMRGDALFN